MRNTSDYLNRPIFISGYHKSGTTLLLSVLDGHPELVVIPEELNFYKSVLYAKDKGAAIREKSGFKMFLSGQDTQEWSHWRTWFREGYPEFDQKEFNDRFQAIVRDHRSFKELMLQMVSAFAGVDHIDPATKSRWVSKTPMEEIYFPVMWKMFGRDCRFVYIVRDPRDVFTSIQKWNKNRGRETGQNRGSTVFFCINWQTRMNQVLEYQKTYDNVCVFRYEDLLMSPEKTLRQLCDFLQIAYSDVLLQPTRHGKQWGGNSVYTEEFKGLSDEPVGRYQKILDPETRAIIEQLLQPTLVSFGYETGGESQGVQADERLVNWNEYRLKRIKYRLRYLFNRHYYRFRYNFPQFH